MFGDPNTTKQSKTGVVSASRLMTAMNDYINEQNAEDSTIDVFDAYNVENRLPRMVSVKLAVASIGLWAYKFKPNMNFATIASSLLNPATSQMNARNCQSFATYITTGVWFSPGIASAISRTIYNLIPFAAAQVGSIMSRVSSYMSPQTQTKPEQTQVEMQLWEPLSEAAAFKEMDPKNPRGIGAVGAREVGKRIVIKYPEGNPSILTPQCKIEKASESCYKLAIRHRIETLEKYVLYKKTILKLEEKLSKKRKTGAALANQKEKDEQIREQIDQMRRALASYYLPPGHTIESDLSVLLNAQKDPSIELPDHLVNGRLALANNIRIKCGDVEVCRNISELRSSLAKQRQKYAQDPATGMQFTQQQIDDIMSGPPFIRDSKLRTLVQNRGLPVVQPKTDDIVMTDTSESSPVSRKRARESE